MHSLAALRASLVSELRFFKHAVRTPLAIGSVNLCDGGKALVTL